MGIKSRGNYQIGVCLRDCVHQGTKVCAMCVKFTLYQAPTFTDAYKQPIKIEENKT
jgi:hypothetical protein